MKQRLPVIVSLILLLVLESCHSPKRNIECAHFDLSHLQKRLDADMILVQGGSFDMGTDSLGQKERPIHRINVDNFYISRYESTIDLFTYFVCATGYITDAERDGKGSVIFKKGRFLVQKGVTWTCDEEGNPRTPKDYYYPVLHLSWFDADTFCKWLSKTTAVHYRLPTEAEWEYAACGGNKSNGFIYSGSNIADSVAWYGPNAGGRVHPVGSRRPNELGIYDMSGNVWEWCSNPFEKYGTDGAPASSHHPAESSEYVSRGGCYLSGISDTLNSKEECCSKFRGKDNPGVRACDGSFRIVRDFK